VTWRRRPPGPKLRDGVVRKTATRSRQSERGDQLFAARLERPGHGPSFELGSQFRDGVFLGERPPLGQSEDLENSLARTRGKGALAIVRQSLRAWVRASLRWSAILKTMQGSRAAIALRANSPSLRALRQPSTRARHVDGLAPSMRVAPRMTVPERLAQSARQMANARQLR